LNQLCNPESGILELESRYDFLRKWYKVYGIGNNAISLAKAKQ
jgi:hypothetical protein